MPDNFDIGNNKIELLNNTDFIDYVRTLGYTNKTNFLGKGYLDDNFNLHLDKWSMFTRFPFTTEEGNKRGCFIHVALTNDEDFKYHPTNSIVRYIVYTLCHSI